MKKCWAFFFGVFLFAAQPLWAYSDRIDASPEEIYNAAVTCFQKEGVSSTDEKKHSLTTKWVYQTIRRTRKRSFIPTRLKESVDIRYQMRMDFDAGTNYSDVSIRGRFEEKPADAPMMQPWKSSSSDKEFYFKEREAVFRLLGCIEENKKAVLAPAVPAALPA